MNKGFLLFLVAALIGALILIGFSFMIFADNVKNTESGVHELYISSSADYISIREQLTDEQIINNVKSFDWVATRMNYPNTIEAGKYLIPDHLSNRKLVELLRYGNGEKEIEVTINNIDSPEELFEKISSALEANQDSLSALFSNDSILSANNLTIDNGWAITLADTYKFNWDTDAYSYFKKMVSEYNNYWTSERKALAAKEGLKPMDCIIIASIIEKESTKTDEYRNIAGVYINRFKKGMPLQADPTVKFALKDPSIQRVLLKHLSVDSPYNTYKYAGLPPGPICLPEKSTIESVLNANKHDYLYFCASADFSGYHTFAKTLKEHNRNARLYQRALDKNGIF